MEGQMTIFEFLREMDNQREQLNTDKTGCYVFARIKNAVPYFTKYCDKDYQCRLCSIDKEYMALRKELETKMSYFDAINKALEQMQSKYGKKAA